jgi:hypothetical protein
VRVAARVDSSSSGIRDGLGAGVEAARREWGYVQKCGGGGRAAEGRDLFLGVGFVVGANCGAAINRDG